MHNYYWISRVYVGKELMSEIEHSRVARVQICEILVMTVLAEKIKFYKNAAGKFPNLTHH